MPEENEAPEPIDLADLELERGKRYELAWNEEDGTWQASVADGTAGARPVVKVSTGVDDPDADWPALIAGLVVATFPL